ncbi:MAG: precorrin-8X methylmutase, partial [Pseudomonadota bacterium]
MSLFDTYVIVDWSARSKPSPARPSKDAIWLGIARAGEDEVDAEYLRTRAEAEARLAVLLRTEATAGRRALAGFDFPFGYPAGVARRVAGASSAMALWDWLAAAVTDAPDNANNRYEVAARINRLYDGVGPFWGTPNAREMADVPARGTARLGEDHPPERRACEMAAKGAKSVWQLAGAGAVGGQVLVGLPALARLRAALGDLAQVWPFESGLAAPHAPVTLAEIYPSLFAVPSDAAAGQIGDELQVRATAAAYRDFDAAGALVEMFAAEAVPPGARKAVAREEAWILGLGHDAAIAAGRKGVGGARLSAPPSGIETGRSRSTPGAPLATGADIRRFRLSPPARGEADGGPAPAGNAPNAGRGQHLPLRYERDPAAIYAASFAAVRSEARLDHLPEDLRDVAIRLVHSCGMTDVPNRLAWSDDVVAAARGALEAGAPVLCDCEMVASGVIRRFLPRSEIVVTLNDPETPARAKAIGNTRSAAAVELWGRRLAGGVVVIGNAPTALFRLLELLDDGAPRPAAILGFPVGFVGAAESKAELARDPRGAAFLTLRGRRGGSAIAAAALNAL